MNGQQLQLSIPWPVTSEFARRAKRVAAKTKKQQKQELYRQKLTAYYSQFHLLWLNRIKLGCSTADISKEFNMPIEHVIEGMRLLAINPSKIKKDEEFSIKMKKTKIGTIYSSLGKFDVIEIDHKEKMYVTLALLNQEGLWEIMRIEPTKKSKFIHGEDYGEWELGQKMWLSLSDVGNRFSKVVVQSIVLNKMVWS